MKIKLLLTLLILTILALIILIGCGGGNDGVTQTSSIITPTPDIKNYGYLIFKVKWPENNTSDKLTISSGNKENELIASVPVGTLAIKIAVMDENTGIVMTTADGQKAEVTIFPPDVKDIKIGPLPAIKVKVGAVSYNSVNLFSKVEKIVQIKPGMVPVDLDLGIQEFAVKAIPPEITLHEELSSSIIAIETPVPLIGETQIIARLVVESPDITEATPTPPFIGKENSNSNNTLESQGVMGLENFEVKFSIIEGNGTLYPIDSQTGQETVSAYTASDGYCNAILKATQPGDITVQASCELIPGDPNSIITRECYVAVIQPPTPTPEPTSTPEPTATPTPLPTPPYPDFIGGTWQEQLQYYQKPTGKSYTVTVTHPVFVPNSNVKVWMGIICTDENGQQQEGRVVTNPLDHSCNGYIWLPGRYGIIHKSPGFASFNGARHHGILWWNESNDNYLLPWVQ